MTDESGEEEEDALGTDVERVARAGWTTVGTAGEYLVQESDGAGRISQYVVSQADFDGVFVITAGECASLRLLTLVPLLQHLLRILLTVFVFDSLLP